MPVAALESAEIDAPPLAGVTTTSPVPPTTYVAVAPGVGVAVTGVAVATGVTGAPRALATLRRPKGWPAMGSVAPRTWLVASALLLPAAARRAARPAASAAAAEVPLNVP